MNDIIYPSRSTELWFSDLTDNIILFSDKDLALDQYETNKLGAFIWQLCDGNHSNIDIAKLINDKIESEKPDIEEILLDVNCYLIDLKNNDLVNWATNKNVDILLVVPPYPELYSSLAINTPEYSAPPLGLAYIAAFLKKNNFSVAIYDMHITTAFVEEIITEYRKNKPRIVGITSTTPTFPNAVRIARILKAYDSQIIIILGGAHASSLPEECAKVNAFDFIVIGEGEQIMLEIANAFLREKGDPYKISGIVFKSKDGVIHTSLPELKVKNLDYLPYPARELLNMESYYQKGSIISSRGCPYECTYCACPLITGREYRTHSVDYVLDEINYIQEKYGINYFDFHDDTFNLSHNRVFEFSNKIIERKMNFTWGCFCRVTNFNYEIAKAMKDSGCEVIQFGVESGNQVVLNSVRKKVTLEEIEFAIISAKKAGISQITCGFIIGHSEDTEVTINETIEFGVKLAKLGATRLAISILTPYPGTEEFNEMENKGVKLITNDWEQFIFSRVVIETKNLNKDKLRELYAKGIYRFLQATNNLND